MNAKTLWWIVAVLVLVVIALWGNRFQRQLVTPEVIETAIAQAGCDLQQTPCTVPFEDGNSVTLDILPKPIPLLSELQLNVTLSDPAMHVDPNTTGIKASFVGINMEMGFNWTTLHAQNKQRYQGKAILPICTEKRMQWEARILIDTPKGVKTAVFPFYTLKKYPTKSEE